MACSRELSRARALCGGEARRGGHVVSECQHGKWRPYSVDVLRGGRVGSIGPVALEGEVVFGSD